MGKRGSSLRRAVALLETRADAQEVLVAFLQRLLVSNLLVEVSFHEITASRSFGHDGSECTVKFGSGDRLTLMTKMRETFTELRDLFGVNLPEEDNSPLALADESLEDSNDWRLLRTCLIARILRRRSLEPRILAKRRTWITEALRGVLGETGKGTARRRGLVHEGQSKPLSPIPQDQEVSLLFQCLEVR